MASTINNIFSRLGAPAASVTPTVSKPLNAIIKTNNSEVTNSLSSTQKLTFFHLTSKSS